MGAIGDVGCFSFQASKNITGGEGGVIVTNDDDWGEKCWSVANVGRQRQGAWYGHIGLASNYRLSEWAAAVLRVQLRRMEEQSEVRTRNAAYLAEALSEVDGLDPVRGDERVTRNAYHLFRLWYDPAAFGGRPAADSIAALQAEGIPVSVGYPLPLNRHRVVVDRVRAIRAHLRLPEEPAPECPVCEDVCARGLWLPQYALLGSRRDMDDIVAAALKVQRAWGGDSH